MSNKKRQFVVFTLILSVLTYTSCIESNKSLGGQFVPEEFVLQVHSTEFDIPVTSSGLDNIQGYNTSYMTFGYIYDETFGYTSGGYATNIAPYGDSTYLGINPELKSAYIYMIVDSVSVIREDQRNIPQNIYIYKLKSDLDSLKLYNKSITQDDYYPTPINVGSPIFFGDDSIKIYLTEEYGRELLATSTAEFDSTQLFMERMKGLYITTDTPDINPGEGRINYSYLGGPTIYVSYALTDPQRGYYKKDTTQTFAVGYTHAINTAQTSSSKLAQDKTSEYLFIESLDGIKPKIKASDISDILNSWISENGFNKNELLISRAYIELPFEFDQDKYQDFTNLYPQQIYPCIYNNNMEYIRYLVPLSEIYTNTNIGMINRSLNSYSCDITNYIQKLLKREELTGESDLYLCPIMSYEAAAETSSYDYMYSYMYGYTPSGEQYYAMDNQDYRHGILNGSEHPERRPKLHITYTIVK